MKSYNINIKNIIYYILYYFKFIENIINEKI